MMNPCPNSKRSSRSSDKRSRISQSAASSSLPFPYRWRLDATAVESRRQRGGRRQCRCSTYRFSESRRRLVRRAAGPLPLSLSSACLLFAALFPFFSARLSFRALLQQNAKKKRKIGRCYPKSKNIKENDGKKLQKYKNGICFFL